MDIVCLGELLVDMFPFHFGSLSLTEEPSRGATMEAVKVAREAGVLISFDGNYRPSLWSDADKAYDRIMATVPHVNLPKVNEVELALWPYPSVIKWACRSGPCFGCCMVADRVNA